MAKAPEKLLGRAVVYRVHDESVEVRNGNGWGKAANTVKGAVEMRGSSLHPVLREFAGTVIGADGDTLVAELLIPGYGRAVAATKHVIQAVKLGDGAGDLSFLRARYQPGFHAVYRCGPEEIQKTVRDGVEVAVSYHPTMTEFAALGGLLRTDAGQDVADLELIIPPIPGRHFGVIRTWLCNVPMGEAPGTFRIA